MSTVHVPHPFLHRRERRRAVPAAEDVGRASLALGGVAALVGLPIVLVAVSLLLP